jgi:hypothetical protein
VKLLATCDTGKFRGIHDRGEICDAMASRDVTRLQAALNQAELEALDGGLAVIYGNRLYSELTKLINDWKFVSSISDNYEYLSLVEMFLAECGRLSYKGEEMFAAVELRQALIIKVHFSLGCFSNSNLSGYSVELRTILRIARISGSVNQARTAIKLNDLSRFRYTPEGI